MPSVIPVVLSGGSGSRLWPKSRHHYPKQLHKLYGSHTMLQHTLMRVEHLAEPPIVICNNDQRFMVAEQTRALALNAEIILEPVARNTAPAIAVAALQGMQRDENAIIAVFPADHLIRDSKAFKEALDAAIGAAGEGKLVTFGVVPTHPETGYGYIKCSVKADAPLAASQVAGFVEKPNSDLAQQYVDSGEYYWNSGMFVFSAKTLLAELEKYHPAMLAQCRQALAGSVKDLDFCRLDEQAFSVCENESVDYALMEKTDLAYMVPLDAAWSDVGSWQALWEVEEKNSDRNALVGDVISVASEGCYASSEGRLIALVGVKDLVVVETADSVLVAHKSRSQDVKKVVEQLKSEQRSEYEAHREVYRPWGSYDVVDTGERFQVKRIKVKPGASLSLQMHHHRAEHWIVVAGTAEIQKGDHKQILTENQSTYIPLGEKHRLSNPGLLPLHLIEVSSGSYLAEDDIVRFEDGYGRV